METKTSYTTEQIRAMLDGITQGTWEAIHDHDKHYIESGHDDYVMTARSYGSAENGSPLTHEQARANIDFASAAPQIVRQLLDEIERLKAGD